MNSVEERINQFEDEVMKKGGKEAAKLLVNGIAISIQCAVFGPKEFVKVCGRIASGTLEQVKSNKVSVKKLTRMVEGRPNDKVEKIEVSFTEEATKSFKKYAKKYGVKYSLIRDKSTEPPTYTVFFGARDVTLVEQCIKEYAKKNLRDKDEKESVIDALKEKEEAVKMEEVEKENPEKTEETAKGLNPDKEKIKEDISR